jgi:hypothetical protein
MGRGKGQLKKGATTPPGVSTDASTGLRARLWDGSFDETNLALSLVPLYGLILWRDPRSHLNIEVRTLAVGRDRPHCTRVTREAHRSQRNLTSRAG